MGEDQKTLEALINDNKDDSIELAENGFQAGEDLYTGATPGVSSLVFQQLATNTDFFKPSNGSLTYFPSFQKYVNYFGGNDQYMDVTCLAGFNGGDADFSVGGGPKFEYSVYNARGRAGTLEKQFAKKRAKKKTNQILEQSNKFYLIRILLFWLSFVLCSFFHLRLLSY